MSASCGKLRASNNWTILIKAGPGDYLTSALDIVRDEPGLIGGDRPVFLADAHAAGLAGDDPGSEDRRSGPIGEDRPQGLENGPARIRPVRRRDNPCTVADFDIGA